MNDDSTIYICGNCGKEVRGDSVCPCYASIDTSVPSRDPGECRACGGCGVDLEAEFDRPCLICGGSGHTNDLLEILGVDGYLEACHAR